MELPVGFEEEQEDPDTNAAVYADDLEDDEQPGARVMTKMTAVPAEAADAYRSLATAAVGVCGRTVESREQCTVDGAPGIRQVFQYHDGELGIDVWRHETYAQMGNVVFSIICLAPAKKASDYAAPFDHASRSARIVLLSSELKGERTNIELGRSFAHEGAGVSLLIPHSWTVTEPTEDSVRFFGPPEMHHDGSSATLSVALGEPDGFGPEGFSDFCDASVDRLERTVPAFALRSRERYSLSSFVDLHALWYTGKWDSDTQDQGPELFQLQALGLLNRYHLYLINAAAPLSLAERYRPIFDGILRSLRVLPARPASQVASTE